MYHFLHLIEGLLNTERLENKLRSRIMEIIGKTAKSKATGMTGIITGINGNKVSISFDGHASISVPVSLLEIDEETMSAIESETTKTQSQSAKTYVKRNNEHREETAYGKIDVLDAKDKICFYKITDILNTCFGTDYLAWMKGTWPLSDYYWCWFPKLVRTIKDEPATFGCINVISEDWNTITYIETKDTVADTCNDPHDDRGIVFAREPDNGPILFRGVYVFDKEQSSYKHYIYKRISTKIKIIGNPAYDIKMQDNLK